MTEKQRIDEKAATFLTYLLMGMTLAPAALAYVAAIVGLWKFIAWCVA